MSARAAGALLPSRLALFAAAQAVAALAVGWEEAAALWPLTATFANLASLALLAWALSREGKTLRSVWLPARGRLRDELKWLFGLLLVLGPVAWLPNVALGTLLFGDPAAAPALLVRPGPAWAAWAALFGFPLTVALSELPTYFGFARPRLEPLLGKAGALGAAAAFLSLQHAALPLLFDGRYLVWRALMFLPFALLIGWVLRRRPSLTPWLMGVHALLDGATVALVVAAARS